MQAVFRGRVGHRRSIGWVNDPVTLPNTNHNPDIGIGRHAVSIDERRCFYRTSLWTDLDPQRDFKAGVVRGRAFGQSRRGTQSACAASLNRDDGFAQNFSIRQVAHGARHLVKRIG
jgi:uncharacterized protein (DUF2235 family)